MTATKKDEQEALSATRLFIQDVLDAVSEVSEALPGYPMVREALRHLQAAESLLEEARALSGHVPCQAIEHDARAYAEAQLKSRRHNHDAWCSQCGGPLMVETWNRTCLDCGGNRHRERDSEWGDN